MFQVCEDIPLDGVSKSHLNGEWTELSPRWIEETRAGRNASRNGLLDGPMLDACGDVRGLSILDCGCGEGRFCRMLVGRGAEYVLGIDLCEPMIAAAREIATGKDEYRVVDAQDLTFLDDGSIDLAVSYLNQCDLPDFSANNREVLRVLKADGRFVVANLHPMRSAVGEWQRNEDGSKQHVILDRYFEEGERHWRIMGVEFTNFHRTLSTYVRAYLDAGFAIEGMIEPTVDSENLKHYPELDDERRVPNFVIYLLKKRSI
jgi:SAM-dependent methyltransferase